MNVTCPSCSTRYSVDDSRIPPSGVTIQCPKCAKSFVVKRDAGGAVPLPGSGGAVPLPGSRGGGAVPLPGSIASAPAPSHTLDALDFGLEDDLPAPRGKDQKSAGQSGMLDFIDQVANKAGVQGAGASGGELRVRRLNGQIEGPFGLQRLMTLVKNGEFDDTCQISPDGRTWKSLTSNPELAKAYSQRAAHSDLPGLPEANDLPGLVGPTKRPSIPGLDDLPGPSNKPRTHAVPERKKNPNATLDALDLDGGLDFEDALPTANLDSSPIAKPGTSGRAPTIPDLDDDGGDSSGGPAMSPEDDGGLELDSDRGKKRGSDEDAFAPPGGAPAAPKLGSMVELADVPTSPPIWVEYRKQILAMGAVIGIAATGLYSGMFTDQGWFFYKTIAGWFAEPPPPPPPPPAPEPPKLINVAEIQNTIDSGTYQGFRSVIATIQKLGETKAPENQLAIAKTRGLASLAYGTKEFPLKDLETAVEGLNKIDLSKAYDGNTQKANLEIIKARMALEILKDQAPSAAGALASAAEQAATDKELHFLLGVARAKLGETVGALDALDKALVADSRYAPALFATGKLMEDREDALTFYQRAVLVQPGFALAAIAAADVYASQKRIGWERRMLALAARAAKDGLPQDQQSKIYTRTSELFAKTGRHGEATEFAEKAQELAPADENLMLAATEALAEQGNGKKAIAQASKALAKDAKNVRALIARARAYMTTDDFGKAFEDLEKARSAKPGSWLPLYWEGVFNYRLGRFDAARDALVVSMTKDAKGEEAALPLIALGRLGLDEGNVQKTFDDVQKALESDPNSIEALALLGKCQRLRRELEKAKETFEKVLNVDPDNLDARLGLANTLRDLAARFPNPALRPELGAAMPGYIGALVEDPSNAEILFEYGRALTLDRQLGAALDLYTDATALNAKDVRPFTAMIEAYMSQDPPDLKAAKSRMETAALIDPFNPEVQFWKGRLQFAEGQYDEASKSFEAAIRKEPKNPLFRFWFGRTYGKQELLFEEIGEYKQALLLNDRFAAARRGLGDAEFARNNFQAALEAYKQYQQTAPEDMTIFRDFARCLTALNKTEESLKAWQDVLRHFNPDVEAFLNIGKIYSDAGKFDLAEKAFEQAYRADPNSGAALCQLALTRGGTGRVSAKARKELESCLTHPNAPEDDRMAVKSMLDALNAEKGR